VSCDPWRVWQAAAVADARALRLLSVGTLVAPTDLDAALADADYLEMRRAENARSVAYRRRKRAS
jgi:hypothetical protein